MGYFLKHTLEFNSAVTEQIRIELYKKSDVSFSVEALKCTGAKRQALSGEGNGADCIISNELTFGIWLTENSIAQWDDFIVSFHDEWKVILYSENQIEFVGFLTPNEGKASLLGIRREVSLTATDNLGLLKSTPLKKFDGTIFTGMNRLIDYIAGALAQTGLQLNIVTYSNIYESSMPDRNASAISDNLNQSTVDYRTFMTDPLTFKDCNSCLEIILKQGYSIEQFNGKWVIQRIGEMQENAGPKIWFTESTYDGNPISGRQYLNDPAIVDKQQIVHPVDGELDASCSYSIKRAKLTYTYTPWPELPKNNTFERGTFIPGIGVNDPVAQTTQRAYTIDSWTFGRFDPSQGGGSAPPWPPGVSLPLTERAYRLSTYNVYGVEVAREIILENANTPGHTLLVCEAVPVKAGDRMDIDFDFKRTPGGTGNMPYAQIWIIGDNGSTSFRLENNNPVDGGGPFRWTQTQAFKTINKFYQGENWQDWSSLSVTLPSMPITGKLYIGFLNYDSTNTKVYYRNFQVTYHPFVAGGYIEAKGDYWNTEQNTNFLDQVDEEVFISDSEVKVLQGTLYRANGIDLTTRSWHRFNVNENRGYKELIDIARYNLGYRRMWIITGAFGGIGYYPANNQAIRMPLSFHKHFVFPNIPKLANVVFQLVPPLTIDYALGKITANFRESFTIGLNDGNQLGDIHEFKYKF